MSSRSVRPSRQTFEREREKARKGAGRTPTMKKYNYTKREDVADGCQEEEQGGNSWQFLFLCFLFCLFSILRFASL